MASYFIPSTILASSDKDFCYDQVGDGHFCFDTEKQCEKKLKHDDIAESPCYNKDRE
jgi:hypothetical protein